MAKTGLKHPVCAIYSDITGAPVYTNGVVIGKAIKSSVSWDKNDAKLNADDDIAEMDNSVIGGKLTIATDDLSIDVKAMLFGHQVVNGELVVSDTDKAPYIGFGVYGRTVRNGETKWRAVFLPKVIFGAPNDETETRGEKIQYQTPTIEGEIMKDINGVFMREKIFDSEEDAVAYLDNMVNLVPQLSKPVASLASGIYEGAQSVALTALTGATIYYTLNGTTPSETNGTQYTSAISITSTCALRAIAAKAGYNNSEVATYEYIIE